MTKGFNFLILFVLTWVVALKSALASSEIFQLHSEIKRISLAAPLSLDDYKLELSFARIDNSPQKLGPILVDLVFYDEQDSPVKISKSLSVRDDECLRDLSQFQCVMRPIALPMTLARTTCKFNVFLKGTRDVALSNEQFITWGKCARITIPTSISPDLSWNEDYKLTNLPLANSPYPREASKHLALTLNNSGNANPKRPFTLLAIGENEKGEIIWQSFIDVMGPLSSQASHNFVFSEAVAPWQWHHLCSLRLIADPEHKIQEISKLNNELELNFGLCEPQDNKRPDLASWLQIENDLLNVHIQNLSPVDVLPPVTFQLEVFDREGRMSDSFVQSYDSTIYGFGDEGIFSWKVGNPQSCRFKVMLDPSDRLRESKRSNNFFELNLCK